MSIYVYALNPARFGVKQIVGDEVLFIGQVFKW